MSATFDTILSDLKKKIYQPIYFLFGEEQYYIDKISDYIEKNVLTDAEKSFNQTILYGKDTDALILLDVAKRYPMMSAYQVVVVKEAQELKNFPPKEEKTPLYNYIVNPLKSTILVLCYKHKSFDKRTKFAKLLKEKSVFFESEGLYDNQVPAWISLYLSKHSRKINQKATQLLAEYLGTDLSKIVNELEKLILNVSAEKTIEELDIEKNIGISKDYNVFELQNAIGTKDAAKTNRIVNYFIATPKSSPLPLTLGFLYSYFSKIYLYHFNRNKTEKELAAILGVNPFFVKDYILAGKNYSFQKTEQLIKLLHEYDLRSKGINNSNVADGELLKEMANRILLD